MRLLIAALGFISLALGGKKNRTGVAVPKTEKVIEVVKVCNGPLKPYADELNSLMTMRNKLSGLSNTKMKKLLRAQECSLSLFNDLRKPQHADDGNSLSSMQQLEVALRTFSAELDRVKDGPAAAHAE